MSLPLSSSLLPTSSAPVQTSSQTELENWITAIHSACAAALARQHHREDTVRLLRTEIRKLEQKIDMDEKMKKMGDMQLSTVTDTKKRKTILEQVRRLCLVLPHGLTVSDLNQVFETLGFPSELLSGQLGCFLPPITDLHCPYWLGPNMELVQFLTSNDFFLSLFCDCVSNCVV